MAIKLIGIGSAALIVAAIVYLHNRFALSQEVIFRPGSFPRAHDTLCICIIGDSWVSARKLDRAVQRELLNHGIAGEVISFGEAGARSRRIYENLFINEAESRSLFVDGVDYCCIVAGVNDAAGQLGPGYYAHHITLIVNTLLKSGIRPVVVSLPRFGIAELNASADWPTRIRNQCFAFFNNGGRMDNIQDYRQRLIDRLREERLTDKIIYLDFEELWSSYEENKCLYANPSHLSEVGSQVFGSWIGKRLALEIGKEKGVSEMEKPAR